MRCECQAKTDDLLLMLAGCCSLIFIDLPKGLRDVERKLLQTRRDLDKERATREKLQRDADKSADAKVFLKPLRTRYVPAMNLC